MPKPVLQAMVLADHVYQDRATGKFVIAGTFATILFGPHSVPNDPAGAKPPDPVSALRIGRVGSPFLYLALVEIHGQIQLTLKYVDLSDASVLFEAQVELGCADPLAVAEYCLPMPLLPVNKEGSYSLDLLYDGEILGSWRVTVRRLEDQPGDSGAQQ